MPEGSGPDHSFKDCHFLSVLYPVDLLLGIILLESLVLGILRNNDWKGLVSGAIVGIYLAAIFQALGIIP